MNAGTAHPTPDMACLLAAARERSGLDAVDYLTIHDLLDLAECRAPGDAPLHALLLALFSALGEGSLCVRLDAGALARRLGTFLDRDAAEEWSRRILARMESGCPSLLASRPGEYRPLVVRRTHTGAWVYFQRFFKYEQVLREELGRRLSGASPARVPAEEQARAALKEVLSGKPLLQDGRPVELNPDQQAALGLCLLRDFVVVSGGPGTGKTALVFSLLRCLLRMGFAAERIRLAAPTGRAAERLTGFIRSGAQRLAEPDQPADAPLALLSGQTIHRLLRYSPSRGAYLHHAGNLLSADAVIVDEVSMVDVVLMAKLLSALPSGAKLICLGDRDQLPSVEAGAVLASLMPAGDEACFSREVTARLARLLPGLPRLPEGPAAPLRDAVVFLRQNYRSQAHIREVARAVNAQAEQTVDLLPRLELPPREGDGKGEPPHGAGRCRWPRLEEFTRAQGPKNGGCWFLEARPGDPRHWRQVLDAWAEHHYLVPSADGYAALVEQCGRFPPGAWSAGQPADEALRENLTELLASLNAARILTLVREGATGCAGVNEYLRETLGPRLDSRAHGRYFAGAPILITQNDYWQQLFNGDVGVVVRDGADGYRAVFARPDPVAYALDSLPPWELAFAITVHKSQGSEYRQVLLALPAAERHRLLSRELIYTAITRARELAVIYGTPEVLRTALRQRLERDTVVDLWGATEEAAAP